MAFDANDLSPHEHFVLDRARLGEVADFSPLGGADGSKPGVRAGFIRKLMLGLDPNWSLPAPGVRIKGARIEGVLDLTDCSALPALSLEACDIPEPMQLKHAALARLSLRHCALSAVRAMGAQIAGVLDLSGVHALEPGGAALVTATGAHVGGDVLARGAKLATPAPRAAAEIARGGERYALDLRDARIGGGVTLADEFAAQGGVTLEAARLGGGLDLRGAAVVAGEGAALNARGAAVGGVAALSDGFIASGDVLFDGAAIDGDVRLNQARFESAAIAIDLSNAEISGSVIGAFKADGALRLTGAAIANNLDLRAAEIGVRKLGATTQSALAIDGARVGVGGAALLQGLNAKGEVLLADARIGGHLALGGGRFINPGAWAIRAPNVRVGGNLTLKIDESGFAPHGQKTVIEGGAKFDRTRIEGAFAWLNVELRGPGPDGAKGGVLTFADASIGGALQARGLVTHQDARLDASGARCASMDDDLKTGWGADGAALELDGFAYGRIESAEDTRRGRLSWLKRSRRFSPQPYAQLAQAYARAGRREDARRVQLAQCDLQTARASSGPITWALSSLFGVTAGYGLAPVRIVRALVLFVALGVVGVLAMNAQGALVTPQGTQCNAAVEPALYAIDVALPIDLGQTERCGPGRTARAEMSRGMEIADGRLVVFEGVALWRWAHALYALLGAILAALAVITFSGVLRPKSE